MENQDLSAMSRRDFAKTAQKWRLQADAENRSILVKIKKILKADEVSRSEDDNCFLEKHSRLVDEIYVKKLKRKELIDRRQEYEETEDIIEEKCKLLAGAIREANHPVVYTGAGISTAASIPDYRGPNGVWTNLSRGLTSSYKDLSYAEPTVTHMALFELHRKGYVKHVVSQNCDGLHLRSGIPQSALSEVHGNMYAEVCMTCNPQRIYWRSFDVTENTQLRRHTTQRLCHVCNKSLSDTIVHFGEKRHLERPQNWQAAMDNASNCDLIICLGSSLKVLKSYRSLWCMNRKEEKRPKLIIANLQWTPKDKLATLKINGKCDTVMTLVAKYLSLTIPKYSRATDYLLPLCTPLMHLESTTFTTAPIQESAGVTTDHQIKQESSENNTLNHDYSDDNKQDINQDIVTSIQTHVAPGWFGKGYRKKKKPPTKFRRKSQSK